MSSIQAVRVLRFMSRAEAAELAFGHAIKNNRDHKAAGNGTDSIGFCFALAGDHESPIYDAASRLSGIVSMEVCLIGTLQLDPKRFKQGYGYYAGPMMSRLKLPEISCVEYSLADFTDHEMFIPNPEAGPFIYSESWRKPLIMEVVS